MKIVFLHKKRYADSCLLKDYCIYKRTNTAVVFSLYTCELMMSLINAENILQKAECNVEQGLGRSVSRIQTTGT